jgi:hypothetical protein
VTPVPSADEHCLFSKPTGRPDGFQSSLVFINCCFAVALGGAFSVAPGVSTGAQFSNILLTGLGVYLVYTLWRQYTLYYIPMQYFRPHIEPLRYEATTLAVTIALAFVAPAFNKWPRCGTLLLVGIVSLSWLKVRQLQATLCMAPSPPSVALEELRGLSYRLMVNLVASMAVAVLVFCYIKVYPTAKFGIYLIPFLPLISELVAPFSEAWHPNQQSKGPEEYYLSLSTAWVTPSDKK